MLMVLCVLVAPTMIFNETRHGKRIKSGKHPLFVQGKGRNMKLRFANKCSVAECKIGFDDSLKSLYFFNNNTTYIVLKYLDC